MSQEKVLNKKDITGKRAFDPIWYILFLGLALRLLAINQSLWLDEATTALVSKMSFLDILTKFGPKDFHPPLYYLLIKITSFVFGTSEIGFRLPSVIGGVVTVYVLYLIGKQFFNKQIGLIAALLLATSPLHIYYSQEARMYALAALFASIVIYSFLNAVNKKRFVWWLVFSCSLVITIGLDYLAGFILLPIWFLALRKYKSSLKFILLSHIPLILAFLVYLPIFKFQIYSGMNVQTEAAGWWNILGRTDFKSILLVPVKFLIGRISFDNKIVYAFFVLAFFTLTGFLIKKGQEVKSSAIPLIWLLFPSLVLAIIGLFVPVFVYFRLLFCLPALYLVVALGIYKLKENLFLPLLSAFLIGNIICSYLYLSNPRFQREDWRSLTQVVTNESKDTSAVTLFVVNSQMEAYHYYNPPVQALDGRNFNGDQQIIWLMRYVQDVFDPTDSVRTLIENKGYVKEKEFNFNGVIVWKYNKSL